MLILASAMSFGQSENETVRSLTVDEAVELAKKNNVSVARSQITLDAVARAKAHSWNSMSPSASVSASSTVPIDALSD